MRRYRRNETLVVEQYDSQSDVCDGEQALLVLGVTRGHWTHLLWTLVCSNTKISSFVLLTVGEKKLRLRKYKYYRICCLVFKFSC